MTKGMEDSKTLPSESEHWYWPDGRPCYTIIGKNGKERNTKITDAFKLNLVPSVTKVMREAYSYGLEQYRLRNVLEAALTLPRNEGETLDDYAVRVMQDAKEHSRKAAERGTLLHAAIERYIQEQVGPEEWMPHIVKVRDTLLQHGIDI